MVAFNIFKWIGSLFTNFLFVPFDWMRLGDFNWWSSNTINWIFMVVLIVLLSYWMKESLRFLKEGTED